MPFTFDFPSGETQLKNTVRIEVEEEHRSLKDLRFIVGEILLGVFNLKNEEILCLQDQERRGAYTITFTSLHCCENIYAVLSNKELKEDRLDGLKFFLLYGLEDVPLVVHLFNPFIDTADIVTFLQRYCTEVRFSHLVKGGLGHWNGKKKFFVKFRKDPDGIGGFMHPPSNFHIGRNRGYLFYPGMPLYCRNCNRFGHTRESCPDAKMTRCNKCGRPGHIAVVCTQKQMCNMCGQEGHKYRDCPRKAKRQGAGAERAEKSSARSEQVSTAVAVPAKKTSGKSGESSVLSVNGKMPVKSKPIVARRSSVVGPENDSVELPTTEHSMKVQEARRKSVSDLGKGIAKPLVIPTHEKALCTLAVGSEQRAMRIPGVVVSEQTFAVPAVLGSVSKGGNTSRRASLMESEQGSEGSSAENPAMTIPDATCEEQWIKAERKKKSRRRSRRGQKEVPGVSGMEKSVLEGPGGPKVSGVAHVSQGKEEEDQHPAEKRLRIEKDSVQKKQFSLSSSSSEGELQIVEDACYVSSPDPVNFADPPSPQQGLGGSQYIPCFEFDMDTVPL